MSNTALYSFVSKPELQRNPKYFLDLSVLCFASLGGSESHLEHLQKVQENDVNLGISKNIVREQQAGYAVAATKQDHALVRELWDIDGQSDRFHGQPITERLGLPV